MAVNLFPAPTLALRNHPDAAIVAAGQDISVRIPLAATDYTLAASSLFGAGIYRIRAYSANATSYATLPVLTFQQVDSALVNVGSSFTTTDADSGNTYGYGELMLTVSNQAGWRVRSSIADTIMLVQRLAFAEAAAVFVDTSVTAVTASQSLALTSPVSCVLFGGGGGGANNSGGPPGGGGGGSGFQTRFSLAAGTYSLVIGAGGAAVSAGGTSSIGGFTALGGNPGGGFGGGSGGSGGGSGDRSGTGAGAGGANGAAGNNNASNNGSPGGGSGVTITGFMGLTAGAGGAPGSSGSAGGFYGGGGGGQIANGSGGSAAPTAYAAGGGGSAAFSGVGGTGGNGVLYYQRGL
jgi:hypothetical protein